MREEVRDPLRLRHILEAARNVIMFMENKTLEDLKTDKLLFFAVVKNIEIIGEASYKLTSSIKENHPEIEWKSIEGMRHVLVHDYYNIKPQKVFLVYKNEIPELVSQIEELIYQYPIPKLD